MAVRWSLKEALRVFNLPIADLMFEAQSVHRQNFNPNEIQISTLLSIKTGACPENCSYCPQSAYYKTDLKKEPLMQIAEVVAAAKAAKEGGSTRFCMGAAWRGPSDRNLSLVCDMVKEVRKTGLETCVTLGLLKDRHAQMLKEAGLDFYNHNIDTSPEYYKKIISTRTFEDRIKTLEHVRNAGIKICCGGILGMGETNEDRIKMLLVLANLPEPPESVPINQLIRIPGTPLADAPPVECVDFVRTVALTRVMIPKCYIRLSAGREHMSEEMQTLCFLAGVNSVFYGEKLLTAKNYQPDKDDRLLSKLGFEKMKISEQGDIAEIKTNEHGENLNQKCREQSAN